MLNKLIYITVSIDHISTVILSKDKLISFDITLLQGYRRLVPTSYDWPYQPISVLFPHSRCLLCSSSAPSNADWIIKSLTLPCYSKK